MCVIMTIQVFGRMVGFGITWSEEFGRYGQVLIVNLGAALVMYDGSHINMNNDKFVTIQQKDGQPVIGWRRKNK